MRRQNLVVVTLSTLLIAGVVGGCSKTANTTPEPTTAVVTEATTEIETTLAVSEEVTVAGVVEETTGVVVAEGETIAEGETVTTGETDAAGDPVTLVNGTDGGVVQNNPETNSAVVKYTEEDKAYFRSLGFDDASIAICEANGFPRAVMEAFAADGMTQWGYGGAGSGGAYDPSVDDGGGAGGNWY